MCSIFLNIHLFTLFFKKKYNKTKFEIFIITKKKLIKKKGSNQ